jgi:hypothetical protein
MDGLLAINERKWRATAETRALSSWKVRVRSSVRDGMTLHGTIERAIYAHTLFPLQLSRMV